MTKVDRLYKRRCGQLTSGISRARLLLNRGVDANFKDNYSSTVLHPECTAVFKTVALVLLTKDAEPNPQIHRELCSLDVSRNKGPSQVEGNASRVGLWTEHYLEYESSRNDRSGPGQWVCLRE